MSKNEIGEDSPIPKFIYLKIRRRDGVESLTTLEEGEFKVPIDGCISQERKATSLQLFAFFSCYVFFLQDFFFPFRYIQTICLERNEDSFKSLRSVSGRSYFICPILLTLPLVIVYRLQVTFVPFIVGTNCWIWNDLV